MSRFLSDAEVAAEGFKPLKKTPTEPVILTRGATLDPLASPQAYNTPEAKEGFDNSSFTRMEKSRGKLLQRGNSFVATRSDSYTASTPAALKGCVVVVDPFSTGAQLALTVNERGFQCAKVLSSWNNPVAELMMEGLIMAEFIATVQHNDTLADQEAAIEATLSSLKSIPVPILAVIAGTETGVQLADALSHRLGLRSNGEETSELKRNKFLMGEAVRNAGVRAVEQRRCTTTAELADFHRSLAAKGRVKCVVKPTQSAGSDDVFLCSDLDEAMTSFSRIIGKVNGIGGTNTEVLVQEYLEGPEFVVDQISRDGQHRICAVWAYDKRPANGAAFVYHGCALVDPKDPRVPILIAYADTVLDAVNIRNGPSHMEVIFCNDGPCLVEVGSRCQGGEGTWIPVAKACIGITQVDLTVDVYTGGSLFDTAVKPDTYTMRKYGREVDLVSSTSGIVRGLPGEQVIKGLASYMGLSWEIKPGDFCNATVDMFTRPGVAQLVHEDPEQVRRDTETIHNTQLIDYTVICPFPPIIGAVVVIDPFSSGANLAAMAIKMGYKLIICFSEKNSPVAKLVSTAGTLTSSLIVHHDNLAEDQTAAELATIEAIKSLGLPVLAILPGAETGVDLADKLATRYGTRNNGTAKTIARRNKYLMQECVRAAGVRAVKQFLATSEEDVRSFYATLNGSDAKCVVKPNESAGSDSIFLCSNIEETLHAFKSINRHENSLGHVNVGALCQEYLSGTEFVIDGVSRDGEYKVAAIWEYDKRSINGANFVYFGMRLQSAAGEREKILVKYAEQVVRALDISNGPSHMEVKLEQDGPCLVEVGSRCHGGEGSWLPVVQECLGYSQLEATLNCYLRPDRFDSMPALPLVLQKHGCEAFMVAQCTGTILAIPGIDTIRALPSFRRLELMTQPGAQLLPTVDCFTRPGSVQMVNSDAEQLVKDYNVIRSLEVSGLFDITAASSL